MCQCDGVWHFPGFRNACGIYSSLWLYIPNDCMLSHILVYFCCITAPLQERQRVTALTQCTCQTSAMTLHGSLLISQLLAFSELHSRLFAAYPSHLFNLIHVTTSLWSRVWLLNCNAAPWRHCLVLQVGQKKTGVIVWIEKLQISISCCPARHLYSAQWLYHMHCRCQLVLCFQHWPYFCLLFVLWVWVYDNPKKNEQCISQLYVNVFPLICMDWRTEI